MVGETLRAPARTPHSWFWDGYFSSQAVSASALDACEEKLLSSQALERETNGNCQKGQLLVASGSGLGCPQICTQQKENCLGQELAPLWV